MIPYNIADISITNGLKNHPLVSGMDYLILLEAPAGADIRVKLNDNTAKEIPLKENYAIKSKNVNNIYIMANEIDGGMIKIGQSNTVEDFEILTSPSLEFTKEVLNELNFAPNGNTTEVNINSNQSYTHQTINLQGIRFVSTHDVGVELKNSGIKYPMLEDEIWTRNLDNNIIFHNDNANAINLIIWDM